MYNENFIICEFAHSLLWPYFCLSNIFYVKSNALPLSFLNIVWLTTLSLEIKITCQEIINEISEPF